MNWNDQQTQSDSRARVDKIQRILREYGIPVWLFYDFRGLDPLAHRILGLDPAAHATRRWFYLVPAEGSPAKLVHSIESGRLDDLPGTRHLYLHWRTLHEGLRSLLSGFSRVAMQYSEMNAIPYVSYVDAGTIELVRSLGVEVVSSADLVQAIESAWSPAEVELHRESAVLLTDIVRGAFDFARSEIRAHASVSEYAIQQWILEQFDRHHLVTDFPPIVAVNRNSGNPHYLPNRETAALVQDGDFLLIDLWAKKNVADAVFADITWTAYFGTDPGEQILKVFEVVRRARDAGIELLQHRSVAGEVVYGWEVDDAVRAVVSKSGFGEAFRHRVGHNLGREVHGTGVNFDNLETHDTRRVIPGVACTIEPGIYLEDFGVRNEINVLITPAGPEVTTPPQNELLLLPV